MTWTATFEKPGLTLESVGGKAVNLARLAQAGFPVPAGFVVTTDAFRAAVTDLGLRASIDAALAAADPTDPSSVEDASAAIRAAFARSDVPEPIAKAVREAYRELGSGPVAVRSSATAEDLPDLSFAGQQDTLLGVTGEAALVRAVVECWSSLWTGRAITYRRRAGIPDEAVALAVAVQRMVPADVSGVLFTANPLTGHRGQMAIDATFGLGEALVSGQVEPDHYVADARTGRVLTETRGSKAVVTTSSFRGGVETVDQDHGADRALTDQEVASLVELGRRVQAEYGTPQDIEWAIAGGEVWLLQARGITSLYPIPTDAPSESVWLSLGAFQGVLAPLSPLGSSALRCAVTGVATLAGTTLDPNTNPWVRSAGERLWIRVDRVLRNPLGARVVPIIMGFGDPGARQIVRRLAEEGQFPRLPASSMRAVAPRLARFVSKVGRNIPRAARDPRGVRAEFDAAAEELVTAAQRTLTTAAAEPDPLRRAATRASAFRSAMSTALPSLLPYAGAVIAAPIVSLRLLSALASDPEHADHGLSPLALEVTRALPHNVTTEMDLALWRVAEAMRADPDASRLLRDLSPRELAQRYENGQFPPGPAGELAAFLEAYGMRGVGEIDLGRPRWRDDPTEVFTTIQRYQDVPPDQSPPAQFARGEQSAEVAIDQLTAAAGRQRFGPLKARLVRGLAERVRVLAGGRELPKFTIIRVMGLARTALLESGADLVAAGLLAEPEDIFLLRLDEVEQIEHLDAGAVRERVERRRREMEREARRTQIPRVLVGDGRAFYEGLSDDSGAGAIIGSPVSPGTAEGLVRVVLDPARSELRHGEILVCPGTDPAWTPLFLSAAGLVTEVGGMMTHGSVVAREYGIPAVVGVHEATTRLVTGQRIRLDGTTGTIVLLDEETPAQAAQELDAAPA